MVACVSNFTSRIRSVFVMHPDCVSYWFTMLNHDGKVLLAILDKMKAERVGDTKVALAANGRPLKLEGQQAPMEPWTRSIGASVTHIPTQIIEYDAKLRADLAEFPGRLQASENHIKASMVISCSMPRTPSAGPTRISVARLRTSTASVRPWL